MEALTIIPLPPLKRLLPNQVVKQETENKPKRVLRCIRGRNIPRRIEENRHINPFNPAVRMASVHKVHHNSYHGANDEKVHQSIIDLAGLEHPLGSDGAPDHGGVVDDFGPVAGETLLVGWGAQVGDVAHHPAEDCFVSTSGKIY